MSGRYLAELPALDCVVEERAEGLVVLSPAIGWWLQPPADGTMLGANGDLGLLERFHRRVRLRLPDGTRGMVTNVCGGGRRRLAICYGQPLLTLQRLSAGDTDEPAGVTRETKPSGPVEFLAPTDGVFYCRPAPDRPAFVLVGQTLETGQPVGLLEVMKTFSQIDYGGDGLPPRAEVTGILVEDGDEVRAGQPLLQLEPR